MNFNRIMKKLSVTPIKMLQDNYGYLIVCQESKEAAVVDPVEPEQVFKAVRAFEASQDCQLRITSLLCTHHHLDHSGGNEGMIDEVSQLEVYGSDDRIPGLTKRLTNNARLQIGRLSVTALHTPCHTTGSLSYFVETEGERAVFTGDTLFVGGCGRFFEGNADQMYHSLLEVLGKLPPDTLVYCGHEYTVGNLRFALTVEPNNAPISNKLSWAQSVSQTVPSTIQSEFETNPFMRVDSVELQRALGCLDAVALMDELRKRKNNYR